MISELVDLARSHLRHVFAPLGFTRSIYFNTPLATQRVRVVLPIGQGFEIAEIFEKQAVKLKIIKGLDVG